MFKFTKFNTTQFCSVKKKQFSCLMLTRDGPGFGFAARVFGLQPNTCRPAADKTKLPVAREKKPLVPRVRFSIYLTK